MNFSCIDWESSTDFGTIPHDELISPSHYLFKGLWIAGMGQGASARYPRQHQSRGKVYILTWFAGGLIPGSTNHTVRWLFHWSKGGRCCWQGNRNGVRGHGVVSKSCESYGGGVDERDSIRIKDETKMHTIKREKKIKGVLEVGVKRKW